MDKDLPLRIAFLTYRGKKTVGGQLRFILPTKMGQVATFSDVPESQVRQVISEFAG